MGSHRECNSAHLDEECGNTPPRDTCDCPGSEGHCSAESSTNVAETAPSERQFFLALWVRFVWLPIPLLLAIFRAGAQRAGNNSPEDIAPNQCELLLSPAASRRRGARNAMETAFGGALRPHGA